MSIHFDSSPEEAAAYLIKQGRPRHSDDDTVRRVAPSVIADPVYRAEIARDAKTILCDQVDVALGVLARNDNA